jgi:hypothetical protein
MLILLIKEDFIKNSESTYAQLAMNSFTPDDSKQVMTPDFQDHQSRSSHEISDRMKQYNSISFF